MYLLYLCKIQVNGRTPSTTACLRRLKLFPSQMYYPCTFCTCVKYKSTAVHHRRRPAFAVLIIPFSDVLPMYLLYLCKIQVSGFHRWCPRSLPSYGSLSLLIAAVLPACPQSSDKPASRTKSP
ncbi:hypothetical protein BAZOLSSOX_2623 [uncultured Gammaproteobacteria bacterium]|nr:hypothetical protein BAZOLSSOX_2623 [uncultured Gammaproteobacteria bacterium]